MVPPSLTGGMDTEPHARESDHQAHVANAPDWRLRRRLRSAAEGYLEVVGVAEYLVYRSESYGAEFPWTLMLPSRRDTAAGDEALQILGHRRFRGQSEATGIRRWLAVTTASFLDWVFTSPMSAGLQERAER